MSSKTSTVPYASATSGAAAREAIVNKRHSFNFIDIGGRSFGKWTVLRHDIGSNWLCRCECGNERLVGSSQLRSGKSKSCRSCGHRGYVYKHGQASQSNGRFPKKYRAWLSMLSRTREQGTKRSEFYQKIYVWPEWQTSFEAFDRDIPQPCDDSLTLDRIDNACGYMPGNVRWATKKQQARNRRTNKIIEIDGRQQTIAAWVEETGIKDSTIRYRISRGIHPITGGQITAVECGLVSFEAVMMPHMLLADGRALIEHVQEQKLLPAPRE